MFFHTMFITKGFRKNGNYKLCTFLLGLLSFSAWATHENVLAFYITNSGMISTLGVKGESDILLTHAVETSSEPALVSDPPTLAFIESPLKFFRYFLNEGGNSYGLRLNQLLYSDAYINNPLRVYVAAAAVEGESGAESQPVPRVDDLPDFVNESNRHCFNAERIKNRKGFFACMFKAEIKAWLPEVDFELVLDQDAHLMAAMATEYKKKYAKQQGGGAYENILMLHSTTYAVPWRVSACDVAGRCSQTKLPQDGEKSGGSYQIGSMFYHDYVSKVLESEEMKTLTEKFKSDLKLKNENKRTGEIIVSQANFEAGLRNIQKREKENDRSNLTCAVYSDPLLHKVCYRKSPDPASEVKFRGAPYMFYRLSQGVGYNEFGDKVYEVAVGGLPSSLNHCDSTVMSFNKEEAKAQAGDLIDRMASTMLDILLTFFYSEYADTLKDNPGALPQLVIVGEKTGVIERYVDLVCGFDTKTGGDIRQFFLTVLEQKTYRQVLWQLLNDKNIFPGTNREFKIWLDDYARPLISNMLWIPEQEFASYLHDGAVFRLEKPGMGVHTL